MTDAPRRRPDGTMMPGHSANPRGRPPKSRNMLTLFNEKRDEKVAIRVDNKLVRMSRMEAWMTNLWNRAVELDPKASTMVLAIMRGTGQVVPAPQEGDAIDEASAEVLEALIGRLPNAQGCDDDGRS